LVGAKEEGREERDDDDDDDGGGAGDLKSQLFIYMTQPRSCGPQAVLAAAKNSVITVLLPSERRQATGHQAGTWPRTEQSGAEHILTANLCRDVK
jgi:hypothetical protein